MSNNSMTNTQSNTLRTNAVLMILRWVIRCVLIGVAIGFCVMLVLNFGLVDAITNKLASEEPTEIVAHVASNEMKEGDLGTVSGKKIDLENRGVKFGPYTATYNGDVHVLKATNLDKLPDDVTVTYRNNEHTNAGVYVAEAIFTGPGYEPRVLTATMTIKKATIEGVEIEDRIVEYNPNGMYSIVLEGKENIPENALVSYYPPAGVKEPGIYSAKAVISVPDENYETLVLEGTLTIIDLKALVSFDNDSYSFVYDGEAHNAVLNTSNIPEEIKDEIEFEVEHKYVKNGVEYDSAIDAGTYTVIARVTADGFQPFSVCNATITVEQADLVEFYGITVEGGTFDYDGKAHNVTIKNCPNTIGVSYEFSNSSQAEFEKIVTPGTYTVRVIFTDSTGNLVQKEEIKCEIVVNKVDISDKFAFKGNKSYAYAEDVKDGVEIPKERTVEINWDDTARDVIKNVIKEHNPNMSDEALTAFIDSIVFTYYVGDGEASVEAPSFSNVGEYAVRVVVSSTDSRFNNFYYATLETTLEIKHATLKDVEVTAPLITFADGKYHTPKHNAPEGATVEYYISGGYMGFLRDYDANEEVPGVKYVDWYRVKVVITDGNKRATKYVSMLILPNPVIIAIFAVIGLLIGLGIAITIILINKGKEDESEERFQRPGEAIAKARGKIVCQSYAKYKNGGVEGRLYLTEKTVEFYNKSLQKSDNNILIPLRNVRNIDVLEHNVIQIRANNEDFVFVVPGCVAEVWKYEMVNVQEAKRIAAPAPAAEAPVAPAPAHVEEPKAEEPAAEVASEEVSPEENEQA